MKTPALFFASLAFCFTLFAQEDENYLSQETAKKNKVKTSTASMKFSLFINLNFDSYVSEKNEYDSLGRMVVTTTYNSSKKETGKHFRSYNQDNRLLLDSAIDDSGKFNYKRLFEYDASGNLTKKQYVEEGDTSVT